MTAGITMVVLAIFLLILLTTVIQDMSLGTFFAVLGLVVLLILAGLWMHSQGF